MTTSLTTLVSVERLNAQLSNKQWVVIDCRFSLADTSQGEQHFAQTRIPGAQYAHLDHHLSSPIIPKLTGRHPLPDAQTLEAQFQQWGITNDTQIIAYDDKVGAIASRLWWLSRWLGHDACAVLNGGFAAWKNAGMAIDTDPLNSVDLNALNKSAASDNESDTAFQSTHTFKRSASKTTVIDKAQVLNDNLCLLDAREAERYRGEHEPIDPVAGHIPGALNAPFLENLNADGTFKSVEELEARFEPVLNQCANKQLTHYCGSGVTAAHNMLAMAHANLNPGAMYAGSFSEWVSQSDAELFPVARLVD